MGGPKVDVDASLLVISRDRLAYIAGLIDGDGYLSIMDSNQPYLKAKIGVAQLWPGRALRVIQAEFGGSIFGPTLREGGRPMARWEHWNETAALIASQLLPFLRVKRSQAVLLVKADRVSKLLPDGERCRDKIERFKRAIRGLNRGWDVPEDMLEEARTRTPGPETSIKSEGRISRVLPYLAGIMDSDGNFKIERKNVKGMLNPHYRIAIRASQVAPSPAIDLFAGTFGGNVRVRNSGGSGYRPLAYWSLHDRSAEPVIAALLPYLVVKAPEARLLLRLRELKAKGKEGITEWVHKTRWQRPIKMRKRCYSAEQVREFDRLYLTLRALHSGVPPLHLPGFRAPTHGALTEEEQALLTG